MNISVVSLTDHRIDVKFADYISTALGCSRDITSDTEFLIVTNGMYNNANIAVITAMQQLPSLYLIDDHTCWVPDLKLFPLCKIASQFVQHPLDKTTPMEYFRVSELALFDDKFDSLQPVGRSYVHGDKCIYWGGYKPERLAYYMELLPAYTAVIGKKYPDGLTKNWQILPFTKDLNELNTLISQGDYTHVFGDEFHNGVNLPYRIYEALMNGVRPIIHSDLIGLQILNIDWIEQYLIGGKLSEYLIYLSIERKDVIQRLMNLVQMTWNRYASVQDLPLGKCTTIDPVQEVLDQRGTVYGSYAAGVECRATIMEALDKLHYECNGCGMPEPLRVAYSDLVLKLMRSVSSPTHLDSWLDLAGYSKLINELVMEDNNVFKS